MTAKAPTPAQLPRKCGHEDYVFGCFDCHAEVYRPETTCETPQDIKRLEAIIERDRTQVAEGVTAIRDVLEGRDWLTEGRGPYEWNDDNWHKEFAYAAEEIRKAVEPLEKIAGDLSNCTKKWEEIQAARVESPSTAADEKCDCDCHPREKTWKPCFWCANQHSLLHAQAAAKPEEK